MRKLLISTALVAVLAGPALAQQVIVQDSGPSAGPVIAVVPAPESVRRYIVDNPRPPVVIEGRLSQGSVVPMDVELVPVPENPEYVYFYDGDNRPVVVRAQDRQVVYVDEDGIPVEPQATIVQDMPDELIGYVRDNPVDPVVIEGDIDIGYEVPDSATLQPVAGHDGYSYFYHDGRPYVVKTAERRVVYYAR
jgi:hypothetical protein